LATILAGGRGGRHLLPAAFPTICTLQNRFLPVMRSHRTVAQVVGWQRGQQQENSRNTSAFTMS
jgi:hypothetical protein